MTDISDNKYRVTKLYCSCFCNIEPSIVNGEACNTRFEVFLCFRTNLECYNELNC